MNFDEDSFSVDHKVKNDDENDGFGRIQLNDKEDGSVEKNVDNWGLEELSEEKTELQDTDKKDEAVVSHESGSLEKVTEESGKSALNETEESVELEELEDNAVEDLHSDSAKDESVLPEELLDAVEKRNTFEDPQGEAAESVSVSEELPESKKKERFSSRKGIKEKGNSPSEKKKHGRKSRKKQKEEEDEDLEFITLESVRDRSKMAKGEVIKDELLSSKKTKRRSVDAEAAKKEKAQKMAKRHWPLIIAGVVGVVVALCLLSFGVKHLMAKKAADNKEQPISIQEHEKNGNEEIQQLLNDYYSCYAEGNVEQILQYAQPMSDSEKSYIQMYSQYVEEYQNLVCYTKTGLEEGSYIVSVSFNVKYKDVTIAAPGMDFFYVRTSDSGSVYIDNTYSPFNLMYQEYTLDQNIIQMIQTYESGEDVIALQAGIQTNYDRVVEQDPALKTMVEETIANAVSAWQAEHQAALDQKAQEAQQQVQQEQETEEAAQQQEAANAETENKAWVYANDTVNIRQEPNETSAVLASAAKGSQIRQLATTESGWSKVKTGEIVGYIKSEYLAAEPVSGASGSGSLTEGQTITLTSSVNIRSSMSETSDRVGLAYAGEKVTIVQSYSEGWCKVNWNGQTGYIRSDILAQQ